MIELQELLESLIKEFNKKQKFNERIIGFTDYKSKYCILKPKVTVSIEQTDGKIINLDITDYFKGVVK